MVKEIDKLAETIEGNRLISEFMKAEGYEFKNINARDYHSSWDWLMPVVERIEKDISRKPFYGFTVEIRDHYCCVVCHEKGKQDGVVCSTPYLTKPESKILAVWNMVVEFIKWYNSYPA